jgi:hypothetical protein
MKTRVFFATMLVAALILSVGTMIVAAQGPTNTSPFTAGYADYQPHQIPANTTLWYLFDYAGDRTKININVPNGKTAGLDFRVYTLDQVQRLDQEDKFVGRGNSPQVVCDTGRCTSVDLSWEGAFPVGGTYFVMLNNPNPVWKTFTLSITGENVWVATPAPLSVATATPAVNIIGAAPTVTGTSTTTVAVPPPPPPPPPPPTVPQPTATKAPSVQNDSPFFAIYVPDNRDQNIPANLDMWYKFDYGGDRSKIFLSLVNGNVSGLEFRLFTPDQAIVFTDNKFIGRGMPPTIVCDQGKCTSNDLVWIGSFSVPGTYFVKVTNPTAKPQTFKLHIEGDNINIIE